MALDACEETRPDHEPHHEPPRSGTNQEMKVLNLRNMRKQKTTTDEEGFYTDRRSSRSPPLSARRSIGSTLSDGRPARGSAVFVDAEAMKAKLRQSMAKPEYDVGDYYHKEGFCQMVARSSIFEKATLSVIAFNAVWIAIDTDMNKAAMLLEAQPVFQFAEHGFCMYFTWEWVMRFCAFRRKRDGLKDAWFCFDSFMVFMMVAETWVLTIVILAMGGNGGFGGSNTGILRLLRLLRLSRMARMAKLLRAFPELLILVKGMASAMRSVIVTLVLLFVLIYVFAIAFRQLTDGSAVGIQYFPDMWVAMHTLWIDGTLLDGPGNIAGLLLNESVVFALLFYFFVLMAALTVMNMLIGVLCEVVSAVAATEREQIMMSTVKEGFEAIIHAGGLDKDGDHMISRQEFIGILEDPDAVKLLQKVDVDVYAFVDLADFLFSEEDGDGDHNGSMSFVDFMETVLSLRGSNGATVKDIVDLRKFIKTQFQVMESKLEKHGGQRSRRQSSPEGHPPELGAKAAFSAYSSESRPASAAQTDLLAVVPPHSSSGGPVRAGAVSPGMVSSGSGPSGQLWMQAAELQGVLDVSRSKLHRFLSALPSPAVGSSDAVSTAITPTSPPGTVAVPKESLSNTTATLMQAMGITKSEGGPEVLPGDFSNGSLPGMVRGSMSSHDFHHAGDEQPGTKARKTSGAFCEEAEAALPHGHAPRIGEIKAHLQQLERFMEMGARELRSIQELL